MPVVPVKRWREQARRRMLFNCPEGHLTKHPAVCDQCGVESFAKPERCRTFVRMRRGGLIPVFDFDQSVVAETRKAESKSPKGFRGKGPSAAGKRRKRR